MSEGMPQLPLFTGQSNSIGGSDPPRGIMFNGHVNMTLNRYYSQIAKTGITVKPPVKPTFSFYEKKEVVEPTIPNRLERRKTKG